MNVTCEHTWRGVSADQSKVQRWMVLEQCTYCGEYRERVVKPESNHPNADEVEGRLR